MIAHVLLIIFLLSIWCALVTPNLITRCLALKLSVDSLAIFILGFSGRFDKGDLRFTALLVISMGSLWIVLLILGHRYLFKKQEREVLK